MRKLFKWLRHHKPTTTKVIVWVLLINSVAWVWCSYLFAWFGKEEIAETLSRYIVTEIIAVFAVYGIKALVENISKNTNIFKDTLGKHNVDAD